MDDEVKRRTWRSVLRRPVGWVLRVYVLVLILTAFFQRSLIYHPSRVASLTAKECGLSSSLVTDLEVRADDGVVLHGWLTNSLERPDQAGEATATRPLVVLYFPGNAGNRSMRIEPMLLLNSLGVELAIFDYRGYGENGGKPSEASFARDARVIWDYLTREKKIPAKQIVLYGESLGGGTATRLASNLCKEGIEPGGLILQSTFSSLVDVGKMHFPIVPVSWLLIDRFPSRERVKSVTCPILQIHGERDSIVPFEIGRKLFDATPIMSSGGVEKQFVVLPNTDHNDVYSMGPDHKLFVSGMESFFERVRGKKSQAARAEEP